MIVAITVAKTIASLLPTEFSPKTGMAGHPLFADFNIDRYYLWFYTWLIVPGAVACWLVPLSNPRIVSQEPPSAIALLRELIGVITVLAGAAMAIHSLAVAVLAVVVYGLVRWRVKWSLVICAGLSPVLLYLASRSTYRLEDSGPFPVPWFGGAVLWVALGVSVLWCGIQVKKGLSIRQLEDWAVGTIAMPVLLYLLHVKLPPNTFHVNGDFFHPGEMFVPFQLWQLGDFPWRDFLSYHGPQGNLLRHLPGTLFLENSWWGSQAGNSIYWIPAYFIAWFFWVRRLFPRFPLFNFVLFFVLPVIFPVGFGRRALYHERFLGYPLLLLVLHVTLVAQRRCWAFLLGLCVFAFVVVTPEAGYLPCVLFFVLWMHALYSDRRWKVLTHYVVGVLTAAVAWACYLWSHQALGAFVDYHRYMLYGYRFVYGKPPITARWSAYYQWALWGFSFCTLCLWVNRWKNHCLQAVDWVVGASWLFMAVYCQKFLASADEHILQVYAVGFPVLVWLSFACWQLMWVKQRWIIASGLILCLGAVSFQKAELTRTLRAFSGKFVSDRRKAVAHPIIGSILLNKDEKEILKDFEIVLRHLIGTEPIFDLTSQPLLFYALLPHRPASRFFQAISFASPPAQKDVIADLERQRPKLAVFDATYGFSISHPVPNNVRYYQVSEYLLRHYRPLLRLNGYILLGRADLDWTSKLDSMPPVSGESTRSNIYDTATACDWGYIPYYWGSEATIEGRSVDSRFSIEAGNQSSLELVYASSHRAQVKVFGEPGHHPIAQFNVLPSRARAIKIPLGSCLTWYRPGLYYVSLQSSYEIALYGRSWQ